MVTENKPINYMIISQAVEFYKNKGYSYLEVPWLVGDDAIKKTLPAGATPYKIENGLSLVGSAEQSFVEMMINNTMMRGTHLAVSPCFRNDSVDEIHQKYFLKVELIDYFGSFNNRDELYDTLDNMIVQARDFFHNYVNTKVIETKEGFDILEDRTNIELGSYGIRTFDTHSWVYGTGVAEPRLSYIMKKVLTNG